ncbi:DNA repair protein RadC [Vibrio sp. TH_r3]|uniref:RadC family protein n=1 Tax=Vibrio sp. TH_r3 TaxID=3082084 RepID=UPI002952DE20|nr:DNA repair protein RadC [Vibrio sp. TH_r3]MDV7104186.1 DNA repair protein RadC [Vibrio sp. TH_r3]
MNIKRIPMECRPREKLLSRGPNSLSDAELLAIFLRTGIKGMNVIELADYLLADFGSLRKLFSCNQDEFCQHKGLGEAKFVQLQAVLEMSKRYLAETISKGGAISSPQDTKMYLSSRLRDKQREVFLLLYLDSQYHIITDEILFEGTIDGASVYPREVVKRALFHNATAIIVAHNHPSGLTEPSSADKSITVRIADALALVDIVLLDHFIVGDGEVLSFAERGLI